MKTATSIQQICHSVAREPFLRMFPHPWLVHEATDEESAFAASGVAESGTVIYGTGPLVLRHVHVSLPLTLTMVREPQRFALSPVAKGRANLWHGRVLVGRASNNDIVLRDPSVSKLHAHLKREDDGRWRIHDIDSANGTIVDDVRIASSGPGALLRSGARLLLGRLACEFIESEDLYQLLAGGRSQSYHVVVY
jgi:hypothetical protein